MPITPFPNGISSFGVPVLGGGSIVTTGNIYFVHHTGSNGNSGTDPSSPFSTIDYAVSRCDANRGDHIIPMPGHAESITTADAIDLDVAGISIIGLGNGTNRPTITYDLAAAEVIVGADNILTENIVFMASVPDVLSGVTIEDGIDHCTIRKCSFDVVTDGTDEFVACISVVNANIRTTIEDCEIDMMLGNSVQAILLDADTDRTIIRRNIIRGDYSTANIFADTALSTNLLIDSNLLENGVGGDINTEPVIELITNCTATISNNICICNVAANDNAIDADLAFYFNNVYSETVGPTVGIADSHAAVT